jgi:hypothetical protein
LLGGSVKGDIKVGEKLLAKIECARHLQVHVGAAHVAQRLHLTGFVPNQQPLEVNTVAAQVVERTATQIRRKAVIVGVGKREAKRGLDKAQLT